MPFGLDLKSVIVGVLLYAFVIPWVMTLIKRPQTQQRSA